MKSCNFTCPHWDQAEEQCEIQELLEYDEEKFYELCPDCNEITEEDFYYE